MEVLSLTDLKCGQKGSVIEIRGGHGFVDRLGSMNIRMGTRITKLSSIFRRGPVAIGVGNTRLALGFGMAKRIYVKVQDGE
jgi:ferrous iron transport protein A